ncbi:metallophosphoesterase domain-containingprotein [Apiospora rasikravindrae]|uniref:Metallophosphoesterase domain-containingprotein n=1 Tax=Apiospora rasikravindrae TaxID=990691 RepID=A0ABR1U0D1_9PEZI
MVLARRLNAGLLYLGLRRSSHWDKPTLLDEFFESPLKALVVRLYCILLWLRGSSVKPPRNRPPIKVVCLSDTHGDIVPNVPPGDLLIHAGDLTRGGTSLEIQTQINWLKSLPHTHKVVIAGNHDRYFDIKTRRDVDVATNARLDLKNIHYLERQSVTLSFKGQRRLNIFGAPDIIGSSGSSSTNAFQYDAAHHPWHGAVPRETDILVTHGPPRFHLDLDIGCSGLLADTWRAKPKLHIFGHIHCARGKQAVWWDSCQLGYENFLSRKMRGPIWDMVPNAQWLDVANIIIFGISSILWKWLMLGGHAEGGLLINAACQDGNKGKLSTKTPITVEL